MGECGNKARNQAFCNCSFSCSNKGVCCDCLKYHRDRSEIPACYFDADSERGGDRSIDHFVRLFLQKRGLKAT